MLKIRKIICYIRIRNLHASLLPVSGCETNHCLNYISCGQFKRQMKTFLFGIIWQTVGLLLNNLLTVMCALWSLLRQY